MPSNTPSGARGQIGSVRFRLGGMFGHAPYWLTSALIQSASNPRSASNIAPDFRPDSRVRTRRLSCAWPVVSARRTGSPLVSTTALNLGRQSAARPAHQLFTVASNAGSVLVHAHDGGINHLHGRIMACGQCVHKLVPHASPTPANKSIVASGVGTKVAGKIAPRRARTQDPKDAVEHAAVICTLHAARLVRQKRLDGDPFIM
jgi:hypothetical protein